MAANLPGNWVQKEEAACRPVQLMQNSAQTKPTQRPEPFTSSGNSWSCELLCMTENKRWKMRWGYVARRTQEIRGCLTIRAMSYDAENLEFTPGSLTSFTSNAGCSHHIPCQANGASSKDISPRPYRKKCQWCAQGHRAAGSSWQCCHWHPVLKSRLQLPPKQNKWHRLQLTRQVSVVWLIRRYPSIQLA